MSGRLREILSELSLPFRIGYHSGSTGINAQDAYISSVMFFNFLMAFGVAATFGRLLSSDQSEHIRKSTVKMSFILYLIVSIAILSALNFSPKVQRLLSNKWRCNNPPEGNANGTLSKQRMLKYLPVFGLLVYIFGVLAIDILQIASYADCIRVYKELKHQEVYKEACATIVLHLVRAVFCTFLVIFALLHPRDQVFFYKSAKVRYAFAVIIAALFWVWLDSELHHAHELYEGNVQDWSNTNTNCTRVEHRSFDEQCHCKYTNIFRVLRNAGKYIYPLNIEFCLLGVEMVLHFFFTVKDKNADGYNQENQHSRVHALVLSDTTGRDTDSFAMTCVHTSNRLPQVHDDSSPIEPQNNNAISLHTEDDLPSHPQGAIRPPHYRHTREPQVHDDSPTNNGQSENETVHQSSDVEPDTMAIIPNDSTVQDINRACTKWLLFALSIAVAVIYFTFSVCVAESFSADDLTAGRMAYFTFKIIYFIMTITILCFGFWCSKGLRYKHRGYSSFEMLMVGCTFAIFINKFLAIIAAISIVKGIGLEDQASIMLTNKESEYIADHEKLAGYEIATNLFNIVQVYLQTVFMFHSLSIAHAGATNANDNNSYKRFQQVLLYLIPFNATFWIVDSFTIINLESLHSIPSVYFSAKEYRLISHLVFPFSLFYRFNSCLTSIKIYLNI